MDMDRLAKICGLLGSNHAGERASAALKATALLQEAGLTWEAFVHGKVYAPDRKPKRTWRKQKKTFDTEQPHAALARSLLDDYFPSYINERAAEFLRDVAGELAYRDLSEAQAAWLDRIRAECENSLFRKKGA